MKAFTPVIAKLFTVLALVTLLAMPAHAGGWGIAGLWEIEGTPSGAPGPAFTNLATISWDGSITNIDPWFGTGLGQWDRVGRRQYTLEFSHYFLSGEDVGTVTVYGSMDLSHDRNSADGTFITEISIGGVVVDTLDGTITANRQ